MDYGIISSGIRNHMEASSNEERRSGQQVNVLKFPTFDDSDSFRMSKRDSRSELEVEQEQEQEHPGNYILRENPKKTKKFVDSKEPKVCKECGKGFPSLKALCGHMASHSEKERASNKLKPEKKRLVTIENAHSGTESSGPKLRRASRRIKYKNLGSYGIEKEQQEVAISLMLLSRDSSYKGCQNSVDESSSNDSVVLESTEMIVGAKRRFAVAEKGPKLKSDAKTSISEDSDSGYFRNGPKKIKSDVSVDGFLRKSESDLFKYPGVESGSGFSAKLGKSLVHDDDDDEEEEIKDSSKYELRKRIRTGIYRAEEELSSRYNVSQKRTKYQCLTCNKTFSSHTALGGHRASHAKLNNGCFGSICETAENSIETQANGDSTTNTERKPGPPKKSKGHECPICFRVFKSGQALGGHKRSHFIGGREANSTTLARQEPTPESEIAVLFDLNLPAPMEEGDLGCMEW